MIDDAKKIFSVVVTYNRKVLLFRCLESLLGQTHIPDKIIIVDNNSSDGTVEDLIAKGFVGRKDIDLVQLPDNRGGAGGFSAGMRYALNHGADFIWMMDDDAVAEPDALWQLLSSADEDINLYGSVPVEGDRLAWRLHRTDVKQESKRPIHNIDQMPDIVPVDFLPFLGILVSRDIVRRIGLPDDGFFLAADDVEYCLRAQKAGSQVFAVGKSKIIHPAAELYDLRLPFKSLGCLKLPPWKRYYDVRNRLLIAHYHYGIALYYKTIPGSILRLVGSLLFEKNRLLQLKAFYAGMYDGLLRRKGRRHEIWGL